VVPPGDDRDPRKTMVTRRDIPNLITGSRLAAVPVLWGFALAGVHLVVGFGVFYAWLSDAVDGVLARRLDAVSTWGSQFDSLADTLMLASALAWVLMLRPEFVLEYAVPLGVWVGLGVVSYTVAWIRFRRLPDVHLYSAKLANFVGFLFVAHLLAFGDYPAVVAWTVLGICIAAALETCIVVTAFPRLEGGVRTIFQGIPRGTTGPGGPTDSQGVA
jgi:phosphatidylglycerophosphate synthase